MNNQLPCLYCGNNLSKQKPLHGTVTCPKCGDFRMPPVKK